MQEAKLGGEINMQRSESMRLKEKKVKDLMVDKKRLVEVPYMASLAHTMTTLVANKVVAVPVAAPPGQWIGAGGSMIVESDKQTGTVRKHYIGMVTMLDIVVHIAGDNHLSGDDDDITKDLDQRMSGPVSSIIGHSFEGLSLWTLNPNTRLYIYSVLSFILLFIERFKHGNFIGMCENTRDSLHDTNKKKETHLFL